VDGSGVVVMVLVVKDRDGGDGGESGSGEWQIPTNGMDSPSNIGHEIRRPYIKSVTKVEPKDGRRLTERGSVVEGVRKGE